MLGLCVPWAGLNLNVKLSQRCVLLFSLTHYRAHLSKSGMDTAVTGDASSPREYGVEHRQGVGKRLAAASWCTDAHVVCVAVATRQAPPHGSLHGKQLHKAQLLLHGPHQRGVQALNVCQLHTTAL